MSRFAKSQYLIGHPYFDFLNAGQDTAKKLESLLCSITVTNILGNYRRLCCWTKVQQCSYQSISRLLIEIYAALQNVKTPKLILHSMNSTFKNLSFLDLAFCFDTFSYEIFLYIIIFPFKNFQCFVLYLCF